ncbi:FHA domain-containing protein [Flavonifractor sp. An82]|uniref:FHA domain-containing protein n=1 Tax=Flavonifractor sp. An82 TaxID=1965660 RepID=UPI000B385758|nr:FHA domain-containing protein [Flavonifractor sp. An82]OUN23791.1 hypothetical protein B5G34_01510 [Flavonifractor sp. An82]
MEIKSKPVECPNGHYYNAALHASCPICAGAQGSGAFAPTEAPGQMGGGVGSFQPTEAPNRSGSGAFAPTEAPGQMGGYAGGVTVPVGSWNAGVVADPFERETSIGGDLTADGQVEPVVGWLVCVDGPVRGTDFRIHAGYNYIGRESGDIHIHGDQQISRQNHAMIAFDSSELTYYVGPSAGRNLIKVNGKTVLNAVEIHSYDVISIGTTKLMFVALCGEHFRWDVENSHE